MHGDFYFRIIGKECLERIIGKINSIIGTTLCIPMHVAIPCKLMNAHACIPIYSCIMIPMHVAILRMYTICAYYMHTHVYSYIYYIYACSCIPMHVYSCIPMYTQRRSQRGSKGSDEPRDEPPLSNQENFKYS